MIDHMILSNRFVKTFLKYKSEFFLIGVIWYWIGCFVGMAIDYDNLTKDIKIDYKKELTKKEYKSNNYKVSYAIQEFLNDLKQRNIDIDINTIKFAYIKDKPTQIMDTLGSCYWKPYKKNDIVRIKINESIINDPISLKTTVYHELGHCALHLDHNDNFVEKNGIKIPNTIMHSTNLNDEYVYNNIDAYVDSMIADYTTNKDSLVTTIPKFVKSSIKHSILHPFYEVKIIAKNVIESNDLKNLNYRNIIINMFQLFFSLMIEISLAGVITKWIIIPVMDELI
jgi:hypothetical protein